jgi:enoyl-CoA hydratase/carnithine racemase
MTWLLPRLIGTERALDLLISGRTVDAEEARELGLVSRVTEPGEVLAAATAYARDLAANCSPTSMALIKHQVLTDLDATHEQAMRRAYRAMAVLDITGATISAPAVDPMNP